MKKSIIIKCMLMAVIVSFASLGCGSKDDDPKPDRGLFAVCTFLGLDALDILSEDE